MEKIGPSRAFALALCRVALKLFLQSSSKQFQLQFFANSAERNGHKSDIWTEERIGFGSASDHPSGLRASVFLNTEAMVAALSLSTNGEAAGERTRPSVSAWAASLVPAGAASAVYTLNVWSGVQSAPFDQTFQMAFLLNMWPSKSMRKRSCIQPSKLPVQGCERS